MTKRSLLALCVLMAVFAGLSAAQPAQAASLTVNTLLDNTANDGLCSLREAITAANTNTNGNGCTGTNYGSDTITFSVTGTITVTTYLPNITENLTIDGPGANLLTLSANATFNGLDVNNGVSLTIEGVTIANHTRHMSNFGNLTLDNTVFSNNADLQGGGAILNYATLIINNSTFSGNNGFGAAGGAIWNYSGNVTISNSTFSNNISGIAGAIYNGDTLTISNSTFTNNSSSTSGGAISNGGIMTITDSVFTNNSAQDEGGAVRSTNNTTISRTAFLGNTSATNGGGLYHHYGLLNLANSTFSGNSAPNGGGISNFGNHATITNITVSGNTASNAGGGIFNGGFLNLRNTIVANSTDNKDCQNYGTLNGSHNLIETACANSGTNNLTNTVSGDPMLGALNVAYFPLLNFSPAIDAGNNSYTTDFTTDQIGQARRFNDVNKADLGSGSAPVVDIGAIENQTSSTGSKISIGDVTLNEGNSGTTVFTFTISLDVPSTQTVTVQYATANGSATSGTDYGGGGNVLTFAPGETSKQITINVYGDTTVENNETFLVNLSNHNNAILADNQAIGRINNDDFLPKIRINDVTITEGTGGGQHVAFTISLSSASAVPVSFNYSTSDGSATAWNDYNPINGSHTFAPGETNKIIFVTIITDTTHELHETFNVNLSNATNATFLDNLGVGTIANNDSKPTVVVNNVSRPEGNSGTTNFPFVVTLSNPSYQTITVNFATSNGTAIAGTDYTARTGSLSFAPGTTSRTVTVVGNGDTALEPNETFNFNLTNPINTSIVDNLGIGTITNDDSAGLIAPLNLSAFAASINEGQSATYTISLNATPAELLASDSLTVALSFDAAYLSITPAMLTFDGSNWNLPQTVTVLAVDDAQALQASISLPVLHSLTAGDVTLNGAPFGVTITDNDALIVPVAPELPQIEAVAPVSPDAPSAEMPSVVPVSPIRETSENPVAFTWIGALDATEYRLLVQTQADRAVVLDVTISAGSCNGNICVLVSQFAPQSGVSYVWTVTPIMANGAGTPSPEAGFSYSPSAPDGLELPGTVIGG